MPILNELMGAGFSGKVVGLLSPDVNSTAVEVPLRFLGKQVWMKSHSGTTTGPNAEEVSQAHGLTASTIDKVVFLGAGAKSGSDTTAVIAPNGERSANNNALHIRTDATNFLLSSESNRSAYNFVSFMLYTLD